MMGPSCSSTACPLDEGEVDSDSAGVDGVFGECIGGIETSIPLGMVHRGTRRWRRWRTGEYEGTPSDWLAPSDVIGLAYDSMKGQGC